MYRVYLLEYLEGRITSKLGRGCCRDVQIDASVVKNLLLQSLRCQDSYSGGMLEPTMVTPTPRSKRHQKARRVYTRRLSFIATPTAHSHFPP